ncbi:MAG: hypothetical protein WD009_05225 [Phycisphaeraceae bacterium]
MAEADPTDRFKDIPALMNPTTPALRRLRARLEGQPLVIQRDLRRHRKQTPEQAEARRKNSEYHARRRAEHRVQVPAELRDPHPLIEQAREVFARAKPDDDGIVRPNQVRRLDVEASPAQLQRALLIFDTLIKALAQRGHEVQLGRRRPRSTGITIAGERITFSLHEFADKRPHELTDEEKRRRKDDPWGFGYPRPPKYDYFPSGKVRLRLNGVPNMRGCWSDGMRYIVEDCLHHLLKAVDEAPARLEAWRVEQERLRREREQAAREAERRRQEAERRHQEEQRRREELERRRETERRRVRRIERELDRLEKADRVRAYADRLEAALTPNGAELLPTSREAKRLRWMRRYADRLDPTKPEAGEPLVVEADPPVVANDPAGGGQMFAPYCQPFRRWS